MTPSPYFIEFHGGRFDGLRQPSDFVLPSTRLELPGPDISRFEGTERRYAVYHHRRSIVTLIKQSPIVTFHLYYVGTKIRAVGPKRTSRWFNSILSVLRGLRPVPELDRRPSYDGILAPSGR